MIQAGYPPAASVTEKHLRAEASAGCHANRMHADG
jgi:hypothetical protein